MSLLSYALATCDAHILYRLIGQKVDPATWAGIFGGGCKKVLQVATAPNKAIPRQPVSQCDQIGAPSVCGGPNSDFWS